MMLCWNFRLRGRFILLHTDETGVPSMFQSHMLPEHSFCDVSVSNNVIAIRSANELNFRVDKPAKKFFRDTKGLSDVWRQKKCQNWLFRTHCFLYQTILVISKNDNVSETLIFWKLCFICCIKDTRLIFCYQWLMLALMRIVNRWKFWGKSWKCSVPDPGADTNFSWNVFDSSLNVCVLPFLFAVAHSEILISFWKTNFFFGIDLVAMHIVRYVVKVLDWFVYKSGKIASSQWLCPFQWEQRAVYDFTLLKKRRMSSS